MNKIFTDHAWDDYVYWQSEDKKIIKKINELIKDIERNGHSGIGKPEALKHDLSGFYSRRITDEHRLVYSIQDQKINIISCRYHY
jgi:toxin YoeB